MHLSPSVVFLLVSILFSKVIFATFIIPAPINRQVKDSFAAIQGVNNGKTYKRDHDGNVLTEFSFKLSKSVGLITNKIVNKNKFKVIVPGGKWNDKTYKIIGSPDFIEGKEYILLLDKSSYGFVVHGLSMGQYELYSEDGKKYLRSIIFANHPKIGKISYDDFQKLLTNNFDHKFASTALKDTNIYKKQSITKNRGRKIASINKPKNKNDENNTINIIWLTLVFASLGIFARIKLRRQK